MASKKYLHLISLLRDTTQQDNLDLHTDCFLSVPSLRVVFLECVECLLLSGQLEECVSLCDRILEKYLVDEMDLNTCNSSGYTTDAVFCDQGDLVAGEVQTESNLNIGQTESRKRQRSMDDIHDDKFSKVTEGSEDVHIKYKALMFKADALVMQLKLMEALSCLER